VKDGDWVIDGVKKSDLIRLITFKITDLPRLLPGLEVLLIGVNWVSGSKFDLGINPDQFPH
jgi:hypothetical protein